jgi:hypothetical protein
MAVSLAMWVIRSNDFDLRLTLAKAWTLSEK